MKKNLLFLLLFLIIALFLFLNTISYSSEIEKKSDTNSLEVLLKEILSFFEPVDGKIASLQDSKVKIYYDPTKKFLPGMRLRAFKEGADFIHPVTKERLGKIEVPIGYIEIESSTSGLAIGRVISGKTEDFIGSKVKIPAIKTKILFHQSNIDWFLGDSYYQLLKESNRFELVDSTVETHDIQKTLSEAKSKKAFALLLLTAEKIGRDVKVTQSLYWVEDGKQFSEKTVTLKADFISELKLKSGLPGLSTAELLFSYDLPFSADRILAGDFDGDQSIDIALVSNNIIRFYTSKVDLNFLWELRLPHKGEIVWIDKVQRGDNSKDLILITAKTEDDIVSYVYELQREGFVKLWSANSLFIRGFNNRILAQRFSPFTGYEGKIFFISLHDRSFKEGSFFELPSGVNIYDFQEILSPHKERAYLVWDEEGYLKLLDISGTLKWRSKEAFSDSPFTFTRETLSGLFHKGSWSIKDRLIYKDGEVYLSKKEPLLNTVRGLGYKESSIITIWWNGLTVEEKKYIESISGEIIDYTITEDRLMILSKPLFGLKIKNILKGESPFGVVLNIYTMRGK